MAPGLSAGKTLVMPTPSRPIRPRDLLLLGGWLGLAAGLLEVFAKVVCAAVGWHGRFYKMSRHFVWIVPLSNLAIFVAFGLLLALLTLVWPRFGRWLGVRWLMALALVPALVVAFPEIYTLAWLALAWGVAVRLAPLVERRSAGALRSAAYSLPVLGLIVAGLAASVFGADWLKASREAARPLPSAGSPNVLLVVLDTVRADHLSVYGYERPTTPTLELLASNGVRFDSARSTAPWTLASHASLFTGKLPRELRVRYLSPIAKGSPTIAGHLSSKGYATAGFVANVLYCGRETGLAEGFTHYEDYRLQGVMDGFFLGRLADRGLMGLFAVLDGVRSSLHSDALAPLERLVGEYLVQGEGFSPLRRKSASEIDRDFLAWLARRSDTKRPFFAFLNFYDAHTPYFPPHTSNIRFGLTPASVADEAALLDWEILDKAKLSGRLKTLGRDAYDDCIRSLDDQLRGLFSSLSDRGLLDNTVVILTADHGEGMGEHDLWVHAESLYLPEIHVPLIVMTPRTRPARGVVREVVSLADIPSTIADMAGQGADSPFPGRSLARTWKGEARNASAVSELDAPDPTDPNQGRSPARSGPLTAIEAGSYRYIHRSIREKEELYDLSDDPEETHDRAGEASMGPVLQRFRAELRRIEGSK